jgi:glycerophosphoryl diester phosphodiesterase
MMRLPIALVFVLLGCGEPRPPMSAVQTPSFTRPRIVAHRGASWDAPENTLAAFRSAWALGTEAVELDVRVTRDGEVVVIHDASTMRTTGVDLVVAEHTLAEITALDAGSWKGPQFAHERIPTLREALATIPPGRAMFVEIKSDISTAPTVAAAVRDGTPTSATVLLQGYDAASLAALATALPDAAAYWTVDPPLDSARHVLPYERSLIEDARRRGFAGLALQHDAVDAGFLAAARAAGLFVDVWTINDATSLGAWSTRDVRWIETDRPGLAPVGP